MGKEPQRRPAAQGGEGPRDLRQVEAKPLVALRLHDVQTVGPKHFPRPPHCRGGKLWPMPEGLPTYSHHPAPLRG